ncbi:hypothetical protein BDF21DRAFT_400920 [Thamnidium elegans]|nr:hypothetical protein BDF21DRAFT_400920 [Thamnidium elegans]
MGERISRNSLGSHFSFSGDVIYLPLSLDELYNLTTGGCSYSLRAYFLLGLERVSIFTCFFFFILKKGNMAKYFDMTKVNTFTVAAPFSDMRVKACSIIVDKYIRLFHVSTKYFRLD